WRTTHVLPRSRRATSFRSRGRWYARPNRGRPATMPPCRVTASAPSGWCRAGRKGRTDLKRGSPLSLDPPPYIINHSGNGPRTTDEGQAIMSIDKSLRRKDQLQRARNVLTRGERIKQLMDEERWQEGRSPYSLPKVKVVKIVVKKAKKA